MIDAIVYVAHQSGFHPMTCQKIIDAVRQHHFHRLHALILFFQISSACPKKMAA